MYDDFIHFKNDETTPARDIDAIDVGNALMCDRCSAWSKIEM
jgi:hypothetical protein